LIIVSTTPPDRQGSRVCSINRCSQAERDADIVFERDRLREANARERAEEKAVAEPKRVAITLEKKAVSQRAENAITIRDHWLLSIFTSKFGVAFASVLLIPSAFAGPLAWDNHVCSDSD